MSSKSGMRRNRIRELLETQPLVLGTFITTTDPTVVDIAALAGYDFVFADAEHASLSLETIAHMVRAARNRGLGIMCRVPEGDWGFIQRVLDVGIDGVQVPHARTANDARWAVSACRYPPEGKRGLFTKGVAAEYGVHSYSSVAELISAINAEVVCNVIIEDEAGVDNIDEILAVPGLDFITVGAGDLSASLGVIGEPTHPRLVAAIEKVLAACRNAKIPTHFPSDAAPTTAKELRDAGIWMLSSGSDALMLLNGMRANLKVLPSRAL
jgi:2-keto-3-deoxy-L-rhamnonate aldolase RhmA